MCVWGGSERLCVCVSVCVGGREREMVCVGGREREIVWRKGEREREGG